MRDTERERREEVRVGEMEVMRDYKGGKSGER